MLERKSVNELMKYYIVNLCVPIVIVYVLQILDFWGDAFLLNKK